MIKKKSRTVLIQGVQYAVYTSGELAKLISRKPISLEKMEQRGVLPLANIRGKDLVYKDGSTLPGRRLYTHELCGKLVEIFKNVKQGVAITGEERRLIAVAFQEELHKITKKNA